MTESISRRKRPSPNNEQVPRSENSGLAARGRRVVQGSLSTRRARRSVTWLASALGVMLVWGMVPSARAQTAQPWLQDRRETQGVGIRAGNLELHPGVAAELGYDSNFYMSAGTETEPLIPTLRLRVTPSFSVSTLGAARSAQGTAANDAAEPEPPKAKFRSSVALTYDKLFALESAQSDAVSRRSYLGANLGAQLSVLPEKPWGGEFAGGYTRIAQPYNNPGQLTLDHSSISGSGDLRWRPGGGLLEWNWGYFARLTSYDDPAYALDTIHHGFRTRGVWRFLPRTGVFYQGDFSLVTHRSLEARVPDSNPVASQLGINGLITPSLGALIMGGWKAIFFAPYDNGVVEEFDNPVGRAELTWFMNGEGSLDGTAADVGFSTLKLGAFHDGYPSDLTNYYRIDKGYLQLSAMLAGVIYLQADAGVAMVRHSPPRNEEGRPLVNGKLREWRQDVSLYGEYRLASTFAVFLNTAFNASPTNNIIRLEDTRDALKYRRFTALLGARWFM